MESKTILNLKPRRVTHISGSFYISLPLDWVNHHQLDTHRTVSISLDEKTRLIIEPMPLEVQNAETQPRT